MPWETVCENFPKFKTKKNVFFIAKSMLYISAQHTHIYYREKILQKWICEKIICVFLVASNLNKIFPTNFSDNLRYVQVWSGRF